MSEYLVMNRCLLQNKIQDFSRYFNVNQVLTILKQFLFEKNVQEIIPRGIKKKSKDQL